MMYFTDSAMSSSLKLGYGCAICSDTFTVNDERNICTIRQCGHVYHEYCVKRWFSTQISQGTQSNCPKCRKPATENQIIRLFLHETVASDNDVTLNDDNAHDIPDDAIVESDGDFAAQLNRQIILEQLTRPSQLEIDTVPGHHERFNNDEYDALIEEFGTIFNDGFDATAG